MEFVGVKTGTQWNGFWRHSWQSQNRYIPILTNEASRHKNGGNVWLHLYMWTNIFFSQRSTLTSLELSIVGTFYFHEFQQSSTSLTSEKAFVSNIIQLFLWIHLFSIEALKCSWYILIYFLCHFVFEIMHTLDTYDLISNFIINNWPFLQGFKP